ncbi:GlxA family transcriptional regulator [Blastopirellula marina]|uniref:Transcriptional regulator, AraC family protein n=1 Tax=Blastopirellula marina DSM 3645 TaxID=314230 RepID=A4A179_9BACT|nr:helix-turn-helix domain-containing protein [Blastopirellula marina]EAQ77431.1 transcriptional regulator, AraC family protein [Blastopirellula marina DSM 3645]
MFLAFPQAVLLDVAGPWDVFHNANQLWEKSPQPYSLELVAAAGGLQIGTAGGLPLTASKTIQSCRGPIDTLVVPAADGLEPEEVSPETIRHICRLAAQSRRVVSVCTGAFILAAAGLLNGRRVTTHWRCGSDLARRYPSISVESDQIYIRDGNVYTSAGVTAGMDLAIALLEEDLGRELALRVARNLVMFIRRAGGQTQFSTTLESQIAERDSLRDLLAWATDHLNRDLSVEALADQVHMSPRNFARVFRKELGSTPAKFIERLRVESARNMLESSTADHGEIATKCGFGGVNAMRRAFLRVLKVIPSEYRDRFSSNDRKTSEVD